jgi:archaellum component FlaC
MKINNKLSPILVLTILLGSVLLSGLPMAFGAVATGTTLTINPGKTSAGVVNTVEITAPNSSFGASAVVELTLRTTSSIATGSATISLGAAALPDVRADTNGSLAAGTTSKMDFSSVAAGTYYLYASDDSGTTHSSGTKIVVVAYADSPTVAEDDATAENLAASSEGTLEFDGAGFTKSGTIKVYVTNVGGDLVQTITASSTGTITSEDITLPSLAKGTYYLLFYDVTADLAAMSDDAGSTDYDDNEVGITISPSVTYSVDSINGKENASVKITGLGFTADGVISASSVDTDSITIGSKTTTHDKVTASSTGGFSVTVTMDADVAAGVVGTNADVVFTYDDADTATLSASLPISQPGDEGGDEVISLSAAAGDHADDLTVKVYNFAASKSVTVEFGSLSYGTITTDANGYGSVKSTIPSTPAGTYTVQAYLPDPGSSANADYVVSAVLAIYNSAGTALTSTTYVEDDAVITVKVWGLQPEEESDVIDTSSSASDNLVVDDVAASTAGYLETTYTLDFASDVNTKETQTVTITPATTASSGFTSSDVTETYYALVAVAIASGNAIQSTMLVSGNDLTLSADDMSELKPSTKYEFKFNGSAQKVETAGAMADYFTAASDGTSPALEFNISTGTSHGIYDLVLYEYEGTVAKATFQVVVSDPDSNTVMAFSSDVHTSPSDTAHVSEKTTGLDIVLYNMAASKADVDITMTGSDSTYAIASNSDADANGVIITENISMTTTAQGTYSVYTDAEDSVGTLSITVYPTLRIDSTGNDDGDVLVYDRKVANNLTVEAYGLKPNTWYDLTLDGTVIADSRIVSGKTGQITAGTGDADASNPVVTVATPAKKAGTYNLRFKEVGSSTVQANLGAPAVTTEAYETITVTVVDAFTIGDATAYPGQVVQLTWDTNVDLTDYAVSELVVFVDGEQINTGKAILNGTGFVISSTTDKLIFGFEMPGGDAGDVTVKLEILGSQGGSNIAGPVSSVIERISGSGALSTSGTDNTADITSIKSTVETNKSNISTVSTNVDSLTTKVDTVSTNVDTVSTNVNTVSTNVSTVSTNVDTVNTNTKGLAADIAAIQIVDNTAAIASIKSSVGSIASSVSSLKSSVSSLSAVIQSGDSATQNAVASAASDVLTEVKNAQNAVAGARSDISAVSANVGSTLSEISGARTDISNLNSGVQQVANGVSANEGDLADLKSHVSGISAGVSSSSTSILVVIILALVTVILAGASLARNARK